MVLICGGGGAGGSGASGLGHGHRYPPGDESEGGWCKKATPSVSRSLGFCCSLFGNVMPHGPTAPWVTMNAVLVLVLLLLQYYSGNLLTLLASQDRATQEYKHIFCNCLDLDGYILLCVCVLCLQSVNTTTIFN